MSLTLYFHPLSSFCMKTLIALYENDTPFTPQIVDFGNEAQADALRKLWPIGKFPVLRDEARNETIPETSIIIEYLDRHYPGKTRFIPDDADRALQIRLQDRFYDLYLQLPMQTIVGDRLRPADQKDPLGVAQAEARLSTAYGMIERDIVKQTWTVDHESAWPIARPPRRCSMLTRCCRWLTAIQTRPPISRVSCNAPHSPACWRRRSLTSTFSRNRTKERRHDTASSCFAR